MGFYSAVFERTRALPSSMQKGVLHLLIRMSFAASSLGHRDITFTDHNEFLSIHWSYKSILYTKLQHSVIYGRRTGTARGTNKGDGDDSVTNHKRFYQPNKSETRKLHI